MTKRIQHIRTTILRSLMVVAMIVCGVGESWGEWTDDNGVTFTPISGSKSGSEGYTYACDGSTSTKYGYGTLPANVVLEASQAINLTGYTITTANDNATWTGRNPKTWTIEGSNDNSTWTTLVEVSNDATLQDVNYTEYSFTCSTSGYYKYFRFTVSAIGSGNYMQYSEFHPIGTPDPDALVSVGYVITYQNAHFLGGTSTTDITIFNPSTCLWTGSNDSTWKNGKTYYLNFSQNPETPSGTGTKSITQDLQLSTTSSRTFKIDNNKLYSEANSSANRTYSWRSWTYSTSNWFIRWSGTAWEASTTDDNQDLVLYSVNRKTYLEEKGEPTISGENTFETTDTKKYSIGTEAKYKQAYFDYIFYDDKHHYCLTTSSNAGSAPDYDSFNYTWSLTIDGSEVTKDGNGYVKFDTSTRDITYDNYYSSSKTGTLTLTAISTRDNTISYTVTKDITFETAKVDPTAVSASDITVYVGKTQNIAVTLTPDPCYKKLVFTPANTTLLSIDEKGTATGIAIGTTTVNIKAYKFSDKSQYVETSINATVKDKCATPTITASGLTCTFSCSHPTTGVTFRYTIDGDAPTSTTGTTGNSVTLSGYNHTIRVIATADGYDPSDVAELYVSEHPSGSGTEAEPYIITNASQLNDVADLITSNASACFKVTADITASGYTPSSTAFTGTFDGGFYTISGLTNALFSSVSGGTVKNVILDNVDIDGSGNRGAIANEASGNTRIYNCGVLATGSTFEFDQAYTSSSKVTSTDACAGSIVGIISGNTRVLNCYSYADVSGSTYGAGIVGRSTGTWINVTTVQSTQCFVMNCMFYGDVSGGTMSPIVNATTNDNYSMYSYFRYKSISNVSSLAQNGALAIQEDMWLKRFAFFQAAVTNHRDLAALYCFNDATRISEIAQWYVNEDVAPWPILRKAEAQKTTLNRVIPNTGDANEGNLVTNGKQLLDVNDKTKVIENDVTKRYNMSVGSSGYLTVNYTINDGTVSTSNSVQLPITDMDYEHYDYTWGKVVLPFINEFDAWRDATNKDYSKVCIGWEITSMTGGTTGTLTDYNYADRNCTAKDIYNSTTNPLLYAQGGNFIVPYGVTAININAHFATAYYLSDASYDCTASGGTTRGTRPTTYHGKTVYNTAAAAWAAMTATTTSPNEQAIVLVGNYHYTSNTSGTYTGKGCTVLSVDDDNDQQPDYGWYSSVGDYRQYWPSMRWDFVPIIGAGMAQKYDSMPPGLAIPVATGWWEMTETTLCRTFEFEISDNHRTYEDNGYGNNCYIINGGWFQQLVRCWDGECNRLSYVKVGGNAYIKEFFHGNHSSQYQKWTVRPINVTGGEIPSCFMTGMGNKNVISTTNNNIRFYCAGGKIDKYLSVYMEYPIVDATMKVDHAYINRFFGGGTTGKAQLTGNIDITMDHSDVTFFCGGPEFGDMTSGKTVTVNTTGSIFGEYYGAGFGGTALTRNLNTEGSNSMSAINNYSSCYLTYDASKGGLGVSYEMEALLNGSGTALYRFYDYYAALSLATTGSVTTNATKCLFKNSFYGGGCQGQVNGTISSTLTDCDVTANVFGGGYKAAATTIDVYPTTTPTYPTFNTTYKAFSEMAYPESTEYTWISGTSTGTVSGTTVQSGLTEEESKTLGQVTDNISIIVQSSATGAATVGGSVFGGGNESSSLKNTEVKILGNTEVTGSVYGGGNEATVGGTTTVQIGDVCE